jgi:hypothetical protein
MRAAEQALIDGGETVSSLMETRRHRRGGLGLAHRRGPPGDRAVRPRQQRRRRLRDRPRAERRGAKVTVVAPLEPPPKPLRRAQVLQRPIERRGHGGVLVDCLFGSGLAGRLSRDLIACSRARPSGTMSASQSICRAGSTATAASRSTRCCPAYDVTLALGAGSSPTG